MSEKIWVTTSKGHTQGNWEYYAAADFRIKAIRDRFKKGKADEGAVFHAVSKITGFHRQDDDFDRVTKDVPGSLAKVDAYEDWLDLQPKEYRRIYGDPGVITKFITEEK